MATTNPLAKLSSNVANASKNTHVIGGIEVDVYGVAELLPETKNVACLWLLNPRLGNRYLMSPIADAAIAHCKKASDSKTGLIVAAFDQRNHGSRQIDTLSNQAWRDGNPRHAQDMFSIFQGTAADTSQLITYLPAYVFPKNNHVIVDHMALGISLGGHSVWHLLLHEPRITTGIVVVGCPDYLSLMKDRARLSKLKTWTQSSPAGSSFVGSEDFPDALVEAVLKYDPTGFFFGLTPPSNSRQMNNENKHIELLGKTLRGKRILNLAGAADKLVPYAKAKPFLSWLKAAVAPDGWYKQGDIVLDEIVYQGVGHEMTASMLGESLHFISQSLLRNSNSKSSRL